MCHIRGYHHQCHHITYRYISICRATYATKFSPSTPLCLAGENPSVVISLADRCINCKFQDFKSCWEHRIHLAEKRRDKIQAKLSRSDAAEEDWDFAQGVTSGWDNQGWGSQLDNEAFFQHDYDPGISSDDDVDLDDEDDEEDEGDDESTSEEEHLKWKLSEAADEVTKLQLDFGRQMWFEWHGYFGGSGWHASKRPGHWRPRKANPRISGGSLLKHVTNVADFLEFESESKGDETFMPELQSNKPIDEGSERSESPDSSICSTPSETSFIYNFGTGQRGFTNKMRETTEFAEKKALATIQEITELEESQNTLWHGIGGPAEEFYDGMLPNWLDFDTVAL